MPTDWVEPTHFRVRTLSPRISRAGIEAIERDMPEPAHWFDPGAVIALEEVVVIAAIDEVYPELRLMERVGNSRSLASLSPVPEPPLDPRVSPVRRFGSSLSSLSPQPEPPDMAILGEFAALLRRYGY